MGYCLIPGETLTSQKLNALQDQPAWGHIAAQFGEFLTILHRLDISSLDVDLPTQDDRGYWAQMYADICELLYDAMRPDARQAVSAHFETYLEAAETQPFTPCLRHGDFGPSNMLYDPKTNTMQGVLDFSSAALGDPAVDLSSLSCYGDDFLLEAMKHYPATEAMLARARFYRGTFALQEALAGAKLNDQRAYDGGIASYI
jgi:aminoglycoside 2''-phosphotransferase